MVDNFGNDFCALLKTEKKAILGADLNAWISYYYISQQFIAKITMRATIKTFLAHNDEYRMNLSTACAWIKNYFSIAYGKWTLPSK